MDEVVMYDVEVRARLDDDEEEERLRRLGRLGFESLHPAFFRESAGEHPEVAEEARAAAEFLEKNRGATLSAKELPAMVRRLLEEREKRSPLSVAGFNMESDPLTRKVAIVCGAAPKGGDFVMCLVRRVVIGGATAAIAICEAVQRLGLRERTLPARDIVEDMRQASKHKKKQRKRREGQWSGAQRKPPRRGNFHDGWKKK